MVFLAPGVGAAVKGIFKALHAHLVTVVYRGRAGEGVEQSCRQLQPLQSQKALGGGEPVGGTAVLILRRLYGTQKR